MKKRKLPAAGLRVLLWILFFTVSGWLHAQGFLYGGLFLTGTDEGLFGFDSQGRAISFRDAGSVRKIIYSQGIWAILASEGIFVSPDLRNWEKRTEGLPIKTIKLFQNMEKSFKPELQVIKDVRFHPENTDIMVCATKDRVYLSRNQGRTWSDLGALPYQTNGIKAVAAVHLPAASGAMTLTVFLSHSVYGTHYIHPDVSGSRWTEVVNGLEKLETTNNPDEVSDIAIITGNTGTEIYVSQTFRRRIYRLNWSRKVYDLIWSDDSVFGTVDSLNAGKTSIRFLMEGVAAEINYPETGQRAQIENRQDLQAAIISAETSFRQRPNCIVIRDRRGQDDFIMLNELWLINGGTGGYVKEAEGREGLYMPTNRAMEANTLKPFLDLMAERDLNMIVIDMKDDYGRLRFTPNNTYISEKGRVFWPIDIDTLLPDLKARGIYTVARLVVFKDPVLAARENGKYAVWDRRNNRPWAGYFDRRQPKGTGAPASSARETQILPSTDPDSEVLRTFYDERWVDPYSEEVWEYTAAIAIELHKRGFDEIQFDYIRFPTDGDNLADARYRWQDTGMDMESAILSFLRHVRTNVTAPISIDIYGANGWYRTGARTGQEVELLAPWVDVICPMYYPSHFEQFFLAQNPPVLRPWRIYYLGTLRTDRIARGQVIVRSYVQAFYLNVSYDRTYYNPEYVRLQVKGVQDAGAPGFTYWNNIGRYDDIPHPHEYR